MEEYTFDGTHHVSKDGTIYISVPKHSPAIHHLALDLSKIYGEHLVWRESSEESPRQYIAFIQESKAVVKGVENQKEFRVVKGDKEEVVREPQEAAEILYERTFC